jgi:hypothetical protein
LETFIEAKDLVENPGYQEQRQKSLSGLKDDMIDAPLNELISVFNKLSYCFTLQCCYGHFLFYSQRNPDNLDPLPISDSISRVEYRIAYIAFCIENSELGRRLMDALQEITMLDPENIQFCCAEWFWDRQVNSYALQVEPDRFKHQDIAILNYKEALIIERIRNEFFVQLEELLNNHNA